MKNLLLVFVFSCCFFNIKSQNYEPMAIEGAHWIIFSIGINGAAHHAFSIDGDTLIGGVFYKKMYQQYLKNDAVNLVDFDPPYLVESQNLIGVIRDDLVQKKVYYQSFTSPLPGYDTCGVFHDVLLYDFDISTGGTLEGCLQHSPDFPLIVDSVYYQFLFGEMRKSFFSVDFGAELVEAIGTGLGPFWPVYGFVHPAKPTVLVDYCVGGQEACGLFFTPINEIRNDWKIRIFPNPVSQQINLELPEVFAFPVHIKISDMTGRLVLEKTLTQPTYQKLLNVASLPNGIFNLLLQNENGISAKRFVKS